MIRIYFLPVGVEKVSAHYETTIIENIASCRQIIRNLGYTIEIGHDLNDFRNVVASQPLRHKLAPAFNPEYSCLAHRSVLWMCCYRNESELVSTQAIKLIDLGAQNLRQYLKHRMWEIHPYGYDPDVIDIYSSLSEEAGKISGLVTYHGELWLKGGPDGVRGGSFSTLVTRLMLLESLMRWSPGFLIGFQSPLTACKGLSVRESYMRMEQRSVIWQKSDAIDFLEGWLVWMTAKEATFNLRIPASQFVEMLEPDHTVRSQVLARVA